MIRAGENVVQFTWNDEPGRWRDYASANTKSALDKAKAGALSGHMPSPGVKPEFRIGPAIKDHPEWV
jgi:hypothetical protein